MVNPEQPTNSRAITSAALGIAIASGAYALSFGAISVASGFSPLQTQVLSIFMFTGASQFAFIGVLGGGGGAVAAVLTAWLLGARNGLYALSLSPRLDLRGWRRPATAQFTLDESTAMALTHNSSVTSTRLAFWRTGLSIFVLWNLGTLVGALGAAAFQDPRVLGLDAAIPAAFVGMLWPRLTTVTIRLVALAGAVVALALTPFLSPGLPVLAASLVALVGSWVIGRRA